MSSIRIGDRAKFTNFHARPVKSVSKTVEGFKTIRSKTGRTVRMAFATVNGKKVWRSATRKTVSLYKKKNSKRVSVRKKPYLKKKKSTRKN